MVGEDKIIAEVEGTPIHISKVIQTIQDMGDAGAALRSQEGIQQVGEELIHQELLYLDAKKNKMDEDAAYLAAVEQMKSDLLKQYAMQKLISQVTVNDEELKAYYDSHLDQLGGVSIHASHILVEEEDKAKEIMQRIADGADFAEEAKAHSTCPSSQSGGDLGVFGPGQMVKEFDEAAQNGPVGEVQGPVQTQFGYHVILIHERDVKTPSFEEAKEGIRQRYGLVKQQEAYLHKMHELREEYDVKSYL